MKKIIICIAMFVSLNSLAFGARVSGMDLSDIFDENQVGFGYNGGQLGTSLYTDFGGESLRFTINILELGGSLFNNSGRALETQKFYINKEDRDIEVTDSVFLRGLPRFFVGAGYDFGGFKIALGYGGDLVRSNDIITYDFKGVHTDEADFNGPVDKTPTFAENKHSARVGNVWYGNDVSLFLEADIDSDNVIKLAIPIQFGMGMGQDYLVADIIGKYSDPSGEFGYNRGSYLFAYDASDNKAFSIHPQVEWIGQAGYLTSLRLTVPFSMRTRKGRSFDAEDLKKSIIATDEAKNDDYFDSGPGDHYWNSFGVKNYKAESEDIKKTIIGASLEATLSFITEDELADFSFIPSVSFMKAISGNDVDVYSIVGKQNRKNEVDISLDSLIDAGYNFKNPWGLKVSLPFRMSVEKFLISISATPRLDLYVIDSDETFFQKDKSTPRAEAFYGVGYALPIEFSIRPLGNLSFNIGMLAEGRALVGMPSTLDAEIDGSVVWYF